MQSLKIIIAAAIVMFATNFLTSCAPQAPSSIGIQRIEDAQQYKKTVSLELMEVEGEGDVNVRIVLKNPEGKAITSTQTWFSFNPEVIQGLSLNTDESAFKLMAPYDNDFDQESGLVMIGRSNEQALTDPEIIVADMSFKRVGTGAVMIEAYDFKQDLSGHTSANTMEEGVPYNILLKPESPLFTTN